MDQTPGHQISNRTPLLDRIDGPADLRRFPESDLQQIADELRCELIDAVSITGGHFGAGLGVAGAHAKLDALVAEAETVLKPFGAKADVLRATARFIAQRRT